MRSFYVPLLFFSLCFLSFSSLALTYYVSPSGKNSNTGTSISKAWQTISKINSKNFVGDTILFLGGNTFTGNMSFTSSDKGTATKPIVIGSYGTGMAIINGGNGYGISIYNTGGFKIKDLIFQGSGRTTNTQDGVLVYLDKDSTMLPYINIDNIESYGFGKCGIIIGSWKNKSGYDGISVTNSISHDNGGRAGIFTYAQAYYVHKNVYIGYNKTYNNTGNAQDTATNTGSGIIVSCVDGAVIEYCTSYNNGELHSNAKGGPVGIWTSGSNNVIIQFNESHHNKSGNNLDGGGFDFDGGTTNSTMQYNYSHDNYGPGLMIFQTKGLPSMKNNTIRYNISENDAQKSNKYGAITVGSGTTDATKMQGMEIYNNTVYLDPGTNMTARGFTYRSGAFSAVNVRNNIFQIKKGIIILNILKTTGINIQGNCYWSSGTSFKITKADTIVYTSLSAFRSATGKEKVNGVSKGMQADPKFLDSVRGVTFSDPTHLNELVSYKLQNSSTLINKGLNLTGLFGTDVGFRDFWGNDITTDTLYNIGAYQGTSTMNRNMPLSVSPNEQQGEIDLDVYPNPFALGAEVKFKIPNSSRITIELYDFAGRLVRTIFSGDVKYGEDKILKFNSENLSGGAYIIRMRNGEKILSQKIVLRAK